MQLGNHVHLSTTQQLPSPRLLPREGVTAFRVAKLEGRWVESWLVGKKAAGREEMVLLCPRQVEAGRAGDGRGSRGPVTVTLSLCRGQCMRVTERMPQPDLVLLPDRLLADPAASGKLWGFHSSSMDAA